MQINPQMKRSDRGVSENTVISLLGERGSRRVKPKLCKINEIDVLNGFQSTEIIVRLRS